MYECLIVKPVPGDPAVMNAEGPLDNETDADDDDVEELILYRTQSVTSTNRGTDGSDDRGTDVSSSHGTDGYIDSRNGSPMDVDEA